MERRDFLASSFGGLSALVVGKILPWGNQGTAIASLHLQSLNFEITGIVKEMVTHNLINNSECNFWVFKEKNFSADCPGIIIVAQEDESIEVTITNKLDEDHAFYINDLIDSGRIPPGETVSFSFIAPKAGTYLYYDNLNAPVNRAMGLHGALIVMPKKCSGSKYTPYSDPTKEVQALFDDLGSSAHFPGLSWEDEDASTKTPAFRQHVWILHEASPQLFAEVANYPPGEEYPSVKFIQDYTMDKYANTFETGNFNKKPHYFTINGQSGFLSHHNPYITPWRRVGEPVVIRILNAGLYTHSLHIHANHFYLLSINHKVMDNLWWLDTHEVEPMEITEWLLPVMRPPDVPNERGIGLCDPPLIGLNGKPVWPPTEEMQSFFPEEASPLAASQSPLCYPMHDHIEISQTAQGGNYNMGMMSGIVFTGDRTNHGFMNFPNYPHHYDVENLNKTRSAAPLIPHDPDHHQHHEGDIPYADYEIQTDHEHFNNN